MGRCYEDGSGEEGVGGGQGTGRNRRELEEK